MSSRITYKGKNSTPKYEYGSRGNTYQGTMTTKTYRKIEPKEEDIDLYNQDLINKSGRIIHQSTQEGFDDEGNRIVTTKTVREIEGGREGEVIKSMDRSTGKIEYERYQAKKSKYGRKQQLLSQSPKENPGDKLYRIAQYAKMKNEAERQKALYSSPNLLTNSYDNSPIMIHGSECFEIQKPSMSNNDMIGQVEEDFRDNYRYSQADDQYDRDGRIEKREYKIIKRTEGINKYRSQECSPEINEIISPVGYIATYSSGSDYDEQPQGRSFERGQDYKNNKYKREGKLIKESEVTYELEDPEGIDYINYNKNKFDEIKRSKQISKKIFKKQIVETSNDKKDFQSPDRELEAGGKRFRNVTLAMINSRGPTCEDRKITRKMRTEIGGVVDLGQEGSPQSQYNIKRTTRYKTTLNKEINPKTKYEAARIIQSWWRNIFTYEKAVSEITKNSAIKLQSFIRGFLVRKKVLRYITLAIYYQSFCDKIQDVLCNNVKKELFELFKNLPPRDNELGPSENNRPDPIMVKKIMYLKKLIRNIPRHFKQIKLSQYFNIWREKTSFDSINKVITIQKNYKETYVYRKQQLMENRQRYLIYLLEKKNEKEELYLLSVLRRWRAIAYKLRLIERTELLNTRNREYFYENQYILQQKSRSLPRYETYELHERRYPVRAKVTTITTTDDQEIYRNRNQYQSPQIVKTYIKREVGGKNGVIKHHKQKKKKTKTSHVKHIIEKKIEVEGYTGENEIISGGTLSIIKLPTKKIITTNVECNCKKTREFENIYIYKVKSFTVRGIHVERPKEEKPKLYLLKEKTEMLIIPGIPRIFTGEKIIEKIPSSFTYLTERSLKGFQIIKPKKVPNQITKGKTVNFLKRKRELVDEKVGGFLPENSISNKIKINYFGVKPKPIVVIDNKKVVVENSTVKSGSFTIFKKKRPELQIDNKEIYKIIRKGKPIEIKPQTSEFGISTDVQENKVNTIDSINFLYKKPKTVDDGTENIPTKLYVEKYQLDVAPTLKEMIDEEINSYEPEENKICRSKPFDILRIQKEYTDSCAQYLNPNLESDLLKRLSRIVRRKMFLDDLDLRKALYKWYRNMKNYSDEEKDRKKIEKNKLKALKICVGVGEQLRVRNLRNRWEQFMDGCLTVPEERIPLTYSYQKTQSIFLGSQQKKKVVMPLQISSLRGHTILKIQKTLEDEGTQNMPSTSEEFVQAGTNEKKIESLRPFSFVYNKKTTCDDFCQYINEEQRITRSKFSIVSKITKEESGQQMGKWLTQVSVNQTPINIIVKRKTTSEHDTQYLKQESSISKRQEIQIIKKRPEYRDMEVQNGRETVPNIVSKGKQFSIIKSYEKKVLKPFEKKNTGKIEFRGIKKEPKVITEVKEVIKEVVKEVKPKEVPKESEGIQVIIETLDNGTGERNDIREKISKNINVVNIKRAYEKPRPKPKNEIGGSNKFQILKEKKEKKLVIKKIDDMLVFDENWKRHTPMTEEGKRRVREILTKYFRTRGDPLYVLRKYFTIWYRKANYLALLDSARIISEFCKSKFNGLLGSKQWRKLSSKLLRKDKIKILRLLKKIPLRDQRLKKLYDLIRITRLNTIFARRRYLHYILICWLVYSRNINKKRAHVKILYENMLNTYMHMADDIFGNNQAENPSVQDAMFEVVDSDKFQVRQFHDVPLAESYYIQREEERKNIPNSKYIKTDTKTTEIKTFSTMEEVIPFTINKEEAEEESYNFSGKKGASGFKNSRQKIEEKLSGSKEFSVIPEKVEEEELLSGQKGLGKDKVDDEDNSSRKYKKGRKERIIEVSEVKEDDKNKDNEGKGKTQVIETTIEIEKGSGTGKGESKGEGQSEQSFETKRFYSRKKGGDRLESSYELSNRENRAEESTRNTKEDERDKSEGSTGKYFSHKYKTYHSRRKFENE